ncbi:ribonuclease HII [Sulfuriferula plumbiphila]|uniref:Ribonuclease HII n=1 Tax=Sulfuriferula plumbiphila TaxID=171865 RepID=A0A512L9D2_9PROT|nr:ribonuclease HII [Sulfuriferula plumbiphila]BBP05037.1 ribonuclease HII [Sulfuriferula plumbiphila]GEP30751.1 ribonuclease HII [Sulfuriferula plumbiphila]
MKNTLLVCGVDEAGRGPLAGAVFAAAVILDPTRPIDGLDDSKQLSARRREALEILIRQRALAWAVAQASVAEIDAINILQATLLAMKRAVEALQTVPAEVLVDGLHCPKILIPARAIVKGDALEPAISAASILAKTARDRDLLRLHEIYPEYGFDRHKGYPTHDHLAALARHGATAEHRKSYAPVRRCMLAAQCELLT